MAKAAYIGVDDKACKIKRMYIGVDGVARKIKKAYIGVDGVARQFFSSGELVVFPTVALTSNSSNGYVVSSSSENSSAYDAWKAFNKEYSSNYGWASKAYSTDKNPWLQLKMPSAQKIVKFTIANRTFSNYINGVIAATIQGSNNGSTWTNICTISGRNGATSAHVSEHECTDPETPYQYIRIKPTNWNNRGASGGNSYVAIGEIYITCLVED